MKSKGSIYVELGEYICPRCGNVCIGCHGHMTLESYHSVGESESGKYRKWRNELLEANQANQGENSYETF